MSIHQLNKLFQHKGCNIAISVVLLASVATFIGGGGMRGCARQGSQDDTEGRLPEQTVATIGDYKVTKERLEKETGQSIKPEDVGGALSGEINKGLLVLYGKSQGISISDDAVKQGLTTQQFDSMRMELEMQGKLRAGATEQEFENAFKTISGKNLLDVKKDMSKALDDQLKTPDGKAFLEAQLIGERLVDKLKSQHVPSEDVVKAEFDTFHVKEIAIARPKSGADDSKTKADQVLKEIKGGLSFEAAMDKYSSATVPKGKKLSEQPPQSIVKSSLEFDPEKKQILSLKPGEVSAVVTTFSGASIYKLVDHKIELPKDYATRKASLLDSKAKQDASKAITDELKKMDTANNVKWSSEGYHTLHDYQAILPTDPDRAKKTRDIITRALNAKDEPVGGEVAVETAKEALAAATTDMAPKDAAKLRIDVLAAYVHTVPEASAKIELAEAYVAADDKENGPEALKNAADVNSVQTDAQSRVSWDRLNKAIKSAKDKSLLKPEDIKALDDYYAKWQKDYADEQANQKKQAEHQKQVEAELSKNDKKPAPPEKKAAAPPGKAPAKGSSSILNPSANGKQ